MGFGNFQQDHVAELGSARDLRQRAAVQRTAGVDLAIVGGHNIALMDNVALPELERVHPQFVGQLIYSGFHRKQTLGCAVPAVRTR